VATLGRLVELQHAAVAATRAALDRVQSLSARQALQAELRDQSELVVAAEELVREFGGAPPTADESHAPLPADADAIGYAPDDRAVLCACADDYEHLRRAYAEAAADLPTSVRARLLSLAERQARAARSIRSAE
jgi:hypothetical protein